MGDVGKVIRDATWAALLVTVPLGALSAILVTRRLQKGQSLPKPIVVVAITNLIASGILLMAASMMTFVVGW
jgi:hypothetical protein